MDYSGLGTWHPAPLPGPRWTLEGRVLGPPTNKSLQVDRNLSLQGDEAHIHIKGLWSQLRETQGGPFGGDLSLSPVIKICSHFIKKELENCNASIENKIESFWLYLRGAHFSFPIVLLHMELDIF